MVWHCGWASAHKSSDWCYPLCPLVTLVLRLIGFDNPCRLGTEMVALVRVIRLVHILLPVHYTHRVALLSTCPLHPLSAELAWMVWLCGWASAHMSSDWCYPLCALVTLVLRLIGFDNPCRLGTEMVALVRVIRLVHILSPVHYTHRVALLSTCLLHPLRAELGQMVWLCGWASAHMSSDWCYPLWALVTLVLRLIGFDNPCCLGTEMVALVRVIRLVHVLLSVPYTPRVARVRYIHAMRRLTTVVDSRIALTLTWWGTGGVQVASLTLRPLHLPFSSKSRAGLRFREGEEEPVPHGQCFMPVRVPSGIGGWCIIVLPSLSNFRI